MLFFIIDFQLNTSDNLYSVMVYVYKYFMKQFIWLEIEELN